MRILIAPDSFKGSASAHQVCEAIAAGLRRVVPDADLLCVPMADGGEGTVDAVIAATGATPIRVKVRGPLGERGTHSVPVVDAIYARLRGGATVVIEMAAASGLMLVAPDQRKPEIAGTFGVGELIAHALESGARKIIIGIGGSGTIDGGAGVAQALGYLLTDSEGRALDAGGLALTHLDRIDPELKHPMLENVEIVAACDVNNPLCGPQGASQVYGPQKGASPELVLKLDRALAHFADIVERDIGVSVAEVPGAGAAGGLGAGLLAFAGARLTPGFELFSEICGLREAMKGADLVITGEGRVDAQSLHGKTLAGIAAMAKEFEIPAIAFTGVLGSGFEDLHQHGISEIISINPDGLSSEESMKQVEGLLADAAETFARRWSETHSPDNT